MTGRREFLALAGAATGAALLAYRAGPVQALPAHPPEGGGGLFAACRHEGGGRHSAVLIDGSGGEVATITLPGRGHDYAVRPGSGEVVVFARRPGNLAVAFGGGRAQPLVFRAPDGHHFYGHGTFSRDGRLLFATQNEIASGAGHIGVYDVGADYRNLESWPSGGIGPHDIALMADGTGLVVANGGIRTHPDYGRQPLNLPEMAPAITVIDSRNGDLLSSVTLPSVLHQVSLRHFAVAPDGLVAVAAQYMGSAQDRPDLVYTLRPEGELQALTLPAATLAHMRNYITSIAIDADGARLAVSSAKGNRVAIIDLPGRRLVAEERMVDAAGLAPAGGGFLVTDGAGNLTLLEVGRPNRLLASTSGNWDNHARRIG